MTASIRLPGRADRLAVPAPSWPAGHPVPRFRRVYAAPHVAAFPDGTIDWQSTLDFRDHLWAQGFAVAGRARLAERHSVQVRVVPLEVGFDAF